MPGLPFPPVQIPNAAAAAPQHLRGRSQIIAKMLQRGAPQSAPGYNWSDPTWKNPYPQVGSNEA